MKLNIQLFAEGEVVIDVNLATKRFDAQIDYLKNELDILEDDIRLLSKVEPENSEVLLKAKKDYEILENKIQALIEKKQKLENINNEPISTNIGENLDSTNFKLGEIIKKVGKWGLALFSVRSAYGFVTSAVSTLSQYNEKLKVDIENIRYGIASALQPVIIKLVEWAYKFLQAINYVWKLLTGKNLFSNIKKGLSTSNKQLGSANKQAEKLKKTISSFDELNVLSENKTSSGGSTGGGVSSGGGISGKDLTGTDLLSEKDKERLKSVAKILETLYNKVLLPIWKNFLEPVGKWLLEKPERLIGAIATILGFKLLTKISNLAGGLTVAKNTTDIFKTSITKLGGGLTKLAGKIGMKAGGSAGLVGALAVLDAMLVTVAVTEIKNKLIPAIKETNEKVKEAIELTNSSSKSQEKNVNSYVKSAKSQGKLTEQVKKNNDILLKQIDDNEKLNKTYQDEIGIKGLLTGTNKVYRNNIDANNKSIKNNIDALGKLSNANLLTNDQAKKFINICQDEINKLENQNSVLSENSEEYKKNKERIKELKAQIDKTKGTYNINVKTTTDKAKVDDFKKSVDKVEGTHKVKLDADTTKANTKIHGWLSTMGETLFKTMFPKLSFATTLAKFAVKKYAKGGIINLPGKGIPIGGESGKEGVIPLTDSQQMQLLGQEIGKWITINLTNNTNLDGRVIDRRISQIRSNNNFLTNK